MNTAEALQPVSKSFDSILEILQQGVADAVFPGAVLRVGHKGRLLCELGVGYKSVKLAKGDQPSEMTLDTVFDVAELTQQVVTVTIIMKLVELGKLQLDDQVLRYVQGFGVLGKSPITMRHLLTHASGLAQSDNFFEKLVQLNSTSRMGILTSRGARDYVYNSIKRAEIKYKPGAQYLKSELGFILLGEVAELLSGFTLDKACFRFVTKALGLKSTSFVDLSMIKRRGIHPITDLIAPTEQCTWRKRLLCGEVADDNSWAMGGISGSCGLFTNVHELYLFANEILASFYAYSDFVDSGVVREFWTERDAGACSPWHYGWDSPSEENGMQNSGLSDRAVGNNGTTGCSLWIDPERALVITLMSNCTHPTRNNKKIKGFRSKLVQQLVEIVDS